MRSIRRRLLGYLLFLFAGLWALSSSAILFSAWHEVTELFDAQLAQTAAVVLEFSESGQELRVRDDVTLSREIYGHQYERNTSFQLWRGSQLVARSQSAPTEPLSNQEGYSVRSLNGIEWRIFRMEADGYQVCAAESFAVRQELLYQILSSVLVPLLLSLPLLAIVIWLVIGHGLGPLTRVTKEVGQRSANMMQPIQANGVPEEASPLVSALNRLLFRLQGALDKERRFTADASHELRTPLAAIKTQAQVAMRARDEEERQRALESILSGINRSTHLVTQMLTLARLDPEDTHELSEIDLVEVCEQTISELGSQLLDKGQELVFDYRNEPSGFKLKGHAPGLSILIRNLVDNAIRYNHPGGEIHVFLKRLGGEILLQVIDNGPGMPETEYKRVLDRFSRLNPGSGDGCGLGLSIVKRIVELHAGELELGKPDGHDGLMVTVRLPAIEV